MTVTREPERTVRARPRRLPRLPQPLFKPTRHRDPVAVGIVGLLTFAIIALLAYNAESLPVIGGGTTYTADFTEAAGLTPGNEVRVAGVKVGKVTGVCLDGNRVKVTFKVKHVWIGNASTAVIAIKTLLGEKYLAVDPLGTGKQNPAQRIPVLRTTSPYDVTQALDGLGRNLGAIDTGQLAKSFRTISDTFRNTAPEVKTAAGGLAQLSRTISSRDSELAELLAGSKVLTQNVAAQNAKFQSLLTDGSLLLGELSSRRSAVESLLTGTRNLSTQLSGLIKDNNAQLGPTLDALDRVVGVLAQNKADLDRTLALAGPYYRLVGNTLGNGRWMDTYLCGLVPASYLPGGTGTPDGGCMPPKRGG